MIKILVVAIQLLLLTALANAQSSSASVVEKFGLFGTWAFDCAKAPSAANAYADFMLTSQGAVQLRDDFGPDYDQMIYRVVEARRLSLFRLALRQVLTTDDQIVLDTVILRATGKIRNWSSRFADGSSTLVEGGLLSSSEERETGWMTRCDMNRARDTIPAPDQHEHRQSSFSVGSLLFPQKPKEALAVLQ